MRNLGKHSRDYSLTYYFIHMFEDSRLYDVEPLQLAPTCRNFRERDEGVDKILHGLLVE